MSFRETFTRGDRTKQALDYDSTAFYYFFFTILICIFIPWTIYSIRQLLFNRDSLIKQLLEANKKSIQCSCSSCITQWQVLSNRLSKLKYKKWSTKLNWLGLIISGSVLIYTAYLLKDVTDLQMFDPFEVLEVAKSSDDKTIKKAYRILSLKHHPDKNPDDPTATARFMIINKAYQALTDEVAKANWLKYGNPDGPAAMEIGIGLPKFIVHQRFQKITLVGFLIVFVFLLPVGFIIYYENQKTHFPNGVRVETVNFFAFCLNEAATVQTILEFLSMSAESRKLQLRPEEKNIFDKMLPYLHGTKKSAIKSDIVNRNYLLFQGHIHRLHQHMTEAMRADLDYLLELSMPMTQSLLEIASVQSYGGVISTILETRRCLLQGLTQTSPHYAILPHSGTLFKKLKKTESLLQFVCMSDNERKQFLNLTAENELEMLEDIQKFCHTFPQLDADCQFCVTSEDKIVEEDIITAHIQVRRKVSNPDNKCKSIGVAHTYMFPDIKKEELWISICAHSHENPITLITHRSDSMQFSCQLKFLAPPAGQYKLNLCVFSDTYPGIDINKEVPLTVVSKSDVSREYFVHPDDINLDNHPSLLNQMIGGKNLIAKFLHSLNSMMIRH